MQISDHAQNGTLYFWKIVLVMFEINSWLLSELDSRKCLSVPQGFKVLFWLVSEACFSNEYFKGALENGADF